MGVRHQLIVRDLTGERILLIADSHAWSLPSSELDDHHTAETDYINQSLHERFGIEVTVLRCLHNMVERDKTIRAYELELHGADPPGKSGLRWFDREETTHLSWRSPSDRTTVEQWFADDSRRKTALPDWQRAGWWRDAVDWIADSLAANRAGRIVKIVQRRQWDSSCVIHVICADGEYFFKAMPQISHERDVTILLASHTSAVPDVVALHPTHNWMLMRAFAGGSLEESNDVARWAAGLAAYAEIQLQCISMRTELTRLGCPTLDMKIVSDDICALLSDSIALCENEPDGLSARQIDYLRMRAPDLKRGCERLAGGDVPFTIEHGDLWPGNVLVNDAGCVILDWEDVRVAHPFISVAPLIAGIETYQSAMNIRDALNRFCEIYVNAFARFGEPSKLRELFRVAFQIATLEIALRYWHQPPAIVAINPWMRTLVPYFVALPYRTMGTGSEWPE
jgi:Phosphotransferase enzyme family